jgi:hypothetical protein
MSLKKLLSIFSCDYITALLTLHTFSQSSMKIIDAPQIDAILLRSEEVGSLVHWRYNRALHESLGSGKTDETLDGASANN